MNKLQANRWAIVGALAFLPFLPVVASAQTTGGPYQFYTVTPCRLVDSRINQGATKLTEAVTQTVTVKGHCGVPSTAKAVVINLTVVGPTATGFITVWPAGTAAPNTSNINFIANEAPLANGAIAALGSATADLSVVYGAQVSGATTDFLIDVVGYFR